MPVSRPVVAVNGRSYKWPDRPLVVVCIDGSEPDYTTKAMAAGRMPWLRGALARGTDLVRPEWDVVREEMFGPVSPVIRVADIDEAIAVANSTACGLSSGVCTNRLDYITRFVNELNVGTVNVREVPGYRVESSPFGGTKDSGLGIKEGVVEAMKGFTNVKTYSLPWA